MEEGRRTGERQKAKTQREIYTVAETETQRQADYRERDESDTNRQRGQRQSEKHTGVHGWWLAA